MSEDATTPTEVSTASTASTAPTRRRTFLKTVGAGAALASLGDTAAALPDGLTGTSGSDSGLPDHVGGIDHRFDLSDPTERHEALVVFQRNADVDRLAELDLPEGYHAYSVLPVGFTVLSSEQIRRVANWSSVMGVYANAELEWHNDEARRLTNADDVQHGEDDGLFDKNDGTIQLNRPYTGESVHVAVIDTGIDGDHPDLAGNLRANWRFVGVPEVQDEPVMWVDAGPADTDTNGHGTHTSGSVAATGAQSDGQFRGMAPDADVTMYSTGVTLLLVYVVSAWDHLLERKRAGETDVQVVSNSYGPIEDGADFDPFEPVNVAAWFAFNEGIVPLFSAGNSGPGLVTLSQYAKAPYTVGVAATRDTAYTREDGTEVTDRGVTYFSSRGRPNDEYGGLSYDGPNNYDRKAALETIEDLYDFRTPNPDGPFGVYRNDVGAPGHLVMSTLAPEDWLQAYASLWGVEEQDAELWYGKISGTSMSCPVTAGCVALTIDAYQQNAGEAPAPIDVINTLEATAKDYFPGQTPDDIEAADTPDDEVEDLTNQGEDKGEEYGPEDWGYTPENIGTGFVDALAAVDRAEAGDWATFKEAHDSIVSD